MTARRKPRRPRHAALIASLVVVLLLAAGGSSVQDAHIRALIGFNEWSAPANTQAQVALGVPVRRMSVQWNQTEQTRGQLDWTVTDTQFRGLVAAGLRPLVVVVGAPCWAHPSYPCGTDGAVDGEVPPDRTFLGAWAGFVTRVARRYRRAVAIEVWNEPNVAPTFRPGPSPSRYTQVLIRAYHAVKVAAPDMPVISGGLFASPTSGPFGMADAAFLAGMYEAGARGNMDGIGIHPYLSSPNGPAGSDVRVLRSTLQRIRAVRDGAGDRTTALWITETGRSTATQSGFPPAASETHQAADLLAVVREARRAPDVAIAVLHRLVDRPPGAGGPYAAVESGFGVYRPDLSPKPAACLLSRALGGTLRCRPERAAHAR